MKKRMILWILIFNYKKKSDTKKNQELINLILNTDDDGMAW